MSVFCVLYLVQRFPHATKSALYSWTTVHISNIYSLSSHTVAVRLPLNLAFISPRFNFIVFLKSIGIPFRFVLTVPGQFVVLICKLSSEFGDQTKWSVCTLCCTFSVAHFLSLLCDKCQLLHLTQMDVSFDPLAYTLREFMSFSDMCQFLVYPSTCLYTVDYKK